MRNILTGTRAIVLAAAAASKLSCAAAVRPTQPPSQAIYTRRWSVEPITTDLDCPVVIQVVVAQRTGLRRAGRTNGDFRVATLAARGAP